MQIDEEQHMERLQAHRLDGEEVTGDDRGCLGPHELTPGLLFWRRAALDGQDPPDLSGGDLSPHFLELALDAPIAPSRVLRGQAPHEQLHLLWDALAGGDPMAESPLGTDQFAMPATQRLGGDQR